MQHFRAPHNNLRRWIVVLLLQTPPVCFGGSSLFPLFFHHSVKAWGDRDGAMLDSEAILGIIRFNATIEAPHSGGNKIRRRYSTNALCLQGGFFSRV